MSESVRSERQRLFFALWPDDAVRVALARNARNFVGDAPGRRTPADKLHLTLLFLGHLAAADRAKAEAAAAALRTAAFDLILDQPGWFAAARVAWIGPRAAPPALLALREALAAALRGVQIPFDANGFHPHVTCLRKAAAPPDARRLEPVHWPVRDFALVHSRPPAYHVVGRWPLEPVNTGAGDRQPE